MKRVLAPWTDDQFREISEYQAHPKTIGYLCLNGCLLDVRHDRLTCPHDFQQKWVHWHVANGRWRIGVGSRDSQVDWLVQYWHEHKGPGQMHLHQWLGLTLEQYDDFVNGTRQLPWGYVPPRRWNRHPW